MPNLQFALDTSSTASSGVGSFSTGAKGFSFGPAVPSVLGVPWYWFAAAGAAAYLVWRRGGLF